MKTAFIYTLNDPIMGVPRYVGKADKVDRRFKKHLYEVRDEDTYKNRWIIKLLAVGLTPDIVVVSEVPYSEWSQKEKEYIALLKSTGFDLVNGTEGGDGGSGPSSEETKKLLSDRQRGENNSFFGHKHTEKFKLKQSERMSARFISEETRKKMSAGQKLRRKKEGF